MRFNISASAKSRLCGECDEPHPSRGSHGYLRNDGQVVGAVVRTRDNVKPVYISVGHDISLTQAVVAVLSCCTRYRLPEPTRQAHVLVTRTRSP